MTDVHEPEVRRFNMSMINGKNTNPDLIIRKFLFSKGSRYRIHEKRLPAKFITNSIVLGMNTKTIKDITVHKKDSVFNKYVKISEEFKKLEIDRTWDNIPMMGTKSGKSQKKNS